MLVVVLKSDYTTRKHLQKSRTSESANSMSCGTLTVEANARITKKMYGE